MQSLLLSVTYDGNAWLWTVGPEGALPMARGRRWNSWDAQEDAENASRQLLEDHPLQDGSHLDPPHAGRTPHLDRRPPTRHTTLGGLMEVAKVGEIMAKIPLDKLRRAVGGELDGGVFVYWNEGPENAFYCSIPGSDATIYFGADRMDPLTPEESEAFLDRMRSALEASR